MFKWIAKKSGPQGGDDARGRRSALQGEWGEGVAANFLAGRGWRIIGRRVRPCRLDRRCEIDIVAFEPAANRVVFVEVKTHAVRSRYATRIWGVDRRKKRVLLRACATWIKRSKWHGNFRFDVVEVYGSHDSADPPAIDHVENVRLFGDNWRFW